MEKHVKLILSRTDNDQRNNQGRDTDLKMKTIIVSYTMNTQWINGIKKGPFDLE